MAVMSYLVREVYHEAVNRTTGNTERLALIIADDVSSLPANTSAMTYILGSEARIVADGSKYIMNSSGTWVLQPSDNQFENVYTKTETDALLAPLSNQLDSDAKLLKELVDGGHKNFLKLTDTSSTTSNRVSITYNGDGTYTIDSAGQTASADGYFYLARSGQNPLFPKGTVVSGCTGGGSNSYYIAIAGSSVQQYTSAVTLNVDVSGSLIFVFKSGQIFDNLVIKPMVCSKEAWALSQEFEPYCPTLAELYQMVLSI